MKPGTRLEGANGHTITVKSSRCEPHPEGITVYNVEVKGNHNYFVAANGYRGPPVLAHNTCKVYRALTPDDLDNFNAGKRILPKGVGGSIEDQVQGFPTKYISGSNELAGARKFLGPSGIAEIDVKKLLKSGSGIVHHENVIQKLSRGHDIRNAEEAFEILFTNGIDPSAIINIIMK